uniref:Conotoxin-like unassigned superfamily 07 n=1 Tax=Conus ermineus TaxID=55423 RepID=A0A346CIL7_CONER|nr:conotoxin-like precursor unassigned superfamily 07 [Conus ermineus]
MCLSTMPSVILMMVLMFAFDNVDGDGPGQTARDGDNGKFMSSLQSEGEPARFFMPGEKRALCESRSCPDDCGPDCRCNTDDYCVDYWN